MGGGGLEERRPPQYDKWEGERMFSPLPPIIALKIYTIVAFSV